MTALDHGAPPTAPPAPNGIEANGLNVIAESERKGRARDLFWPWFGANVSVLGLSYGSFVLGFGITFLQATVVALIGIVVSFALCGIVALAGRRGSAPTMLLSRAAFGVHGNRLAAVISWVLLVGWETALTSLAVLATSTVFGELGIDLGPFTKIVALIVVAALTVGGGIAGFDAIMRMQKWITVITGVLTVVYIALTAGSIDLGAVAKLPSGDATALIGALVFVMTGFGLGWVNAAADYSRYLPRSTRGGGVFGWTTFGGAVAPIVLVVFGLLLAGSSPKLSSAIGADPIGALTSLLPTWFLVPFAIVAILGLVGGSVLNIYSSGLALLSAGVRVPRYVAAGIDGVLVIAGTIYVAFFANDFVGPFQAFLITLGVPIAAWCGVFIGDVALRRRAYADAELLDRHGRYGSIRPSAVLLVIVGTVLGWGLVVNGTAGFTWQGYLLGPLGGREGAWAYANLGVLLALVLGFVGTVVLTRGAVRRQESLPLPEAR
ncbi:cytosine permease [Amnibacterium soli]|uniref:Cytosine permease n=1 Tax=Amnibacterium soli TaxID=1282736 RepID=A0ABP8Z903_9MICO